jgi:hypothetical protein
MKKHKRSLFSLALAYIRILLEKDMERSRDEIVNRW